MDCLGGKHNNEDCWLYFSLTIDKLGCYRAPAVFAICEGTFLSTLELISFAIVLMELLHLSVHLIVGIVALDAGFGSNTLPSSWTKRRGGWWWWEVTIKFLQMICILWVSCLDNMFGILLYQMQLNNTLMPHRNNAGPLQGSFPSNAFWETKLS